MQYKDSQIQLSGDARAVFKALRDHAFNEPIPSKELEPIVGMSGRRIRDLVSELRRALAGKGMTVVSGDFGYKLSTDVVEIAAMAARLRKHGISELTAARDMGKAIQGMQIPLGLDQGVGS